MNVFALLDSESNGTFCSTKLIHALKLKSRKLNITLNTMEARYVNLNTLVVNLQVEDTQRQNTYLMKGVLYRDCLNISLENLITPDQVYKWSHLEDIADEICLPDVDLADEVHLLIGLDQPIYFPLVRHGGVNQANPMQLLSGLGWTLNGPVAEGWNTVSANFIQADNTLQEAVARFWKLDDPIHINDNAWSATDKQMVHLWEKQAVKEDNHYTLPIPFKDYPPQLAMLWPSVDWIYWENDSRETFH